MNKDAVSLLANVDFDFLDRSDCMSLLSFGILYGCER